MPTLLVVGGVDATVAAAKELGLRVLLLQHPTKITERQRALADVTVVGDYTDWAYAEPVVRDLHRQWRIDRVVSLTEPGLEIAGRVNDLLGLGGTGYAAARRLRDKLAMRQHLAGRDAAAVAAAPVHDPRDLVTFGARHGYPYVVKPTTATASIGVFRVDGPGDHDRVWRQVRRLRGTRTDRVSTLLVLEDFLMEEYLDGREFSVETFSFAGRHVVVTVTEKLTHPTRPAELGHVVPARIGEDERARVCAAVTRFLDHIGIADGAGHTEVKLTGQGPRIVEGHNRYGGDAIPELVRAAFGIDLDRLAVGWPFRLVDELPDRPMATRTAAVRALVAPAGRVLSVDGVEEAARQEGVLAVRISARPGDEVRDCHDNWDRLGLVAVQAESAQAALERGARIVEEHLRVRVQEPSGEVTLARAADVVPVMVG
ncbi:ATP-grasp domain-containing protein [Actinoplanes teichomyceticus]|uniref:ATP-grasp domain-containing protein n=1 Tax=Actinoplanes teichomyceticus TaxID=1867 RepID=A0A561WBM1_ACTTI|nr:ATP-grasp domain-containing protein [Actinoplanes teichomyceticus]TWG21266.1 ATP-grasp domain-containing protein [Actinoplanes teichomyceticus]GIF16721.1 hypothetical protein Ate01nite_67530 [Actinoplanes teichomyceticus]